MPEGWIEDAIESGRILFLVDGFDEVSDQERESVFEWVKRIDPENKCKKLFTSRPQVKNRPRLIKLLEVKMMAMNAEKVEEFVRYWHRAVLKEQLAVSADEAMVTCNSLLDVIEKSNSLRKLAAESNFVGGKCGVYVFAIYTKLIFIRDLTFFISYPIILSSVAIRQDRRESENRNYPLWMSLAFANFFAKRTIE